MPITVKAPEPRQLLVVLLLDTSASMAVDGKIDVLNDSVRRMLNVFKKIEIPGCQIDLSVITFGGEAAVHMPPSNVQDVEWVPIGTSGNTPMGAAISLATKLLNDESVVSRRSYKPNLVLVSDGIPTDEWRKPLELMGSSEHGKRAFRFAVGIGSDLKFDVLKDFAGKDGEVVPIEKVELLTDFFRYVTVTITQVAKSPVVSQADTPTFKVFPTNEIIEF